MKKLKFLGTAVLAASLLFTGCVQPEELDEPEIINPDPSPAPVPDEDPLKDYYKYYLVSSPKQDTNKAIADWGANSQATPNEDGTYTISSSESMWDGIAGICAPFTGFDAGTLANYEYIVFTADLSDFEVDTTETGGNYGVNVKVPAIQKEVSEYAKSNTYRVPLSIFETAPNAATEFAIIIGGTGTVKLSEVYLAAQEDPNNKAITGITITPASANLEKNGTQQFTVKDSNYVNRTSEVTYTLSGDAAEGSSITEDGLLTVGTTAGNITVTAKYEDFTTEATVTVLATINNLITTSSITTKWYNPGWSKGAAGIELPVTEDNGKYTISITEGCTDRWQAQFGLTTDASIKVNDEWYFSCKVKSTANTNESVLKFNNAAALLDKTFTVSAGEEKTISFSGKCTESEANDIIVFFDFGFSGVNEIVISDIVLAKTN